jgi:hypothetical protein
MKSRIIVASLLALSVFALSSSRTTAAPAVKWAAVNLTDTVMIAGVFVSGPVVFVHDDGKMANGEPCTSVHRYVPGKGIGEELVAFHCTPRWGKVAAKFTQSMNRQPGGPATMTEYQFAGDEESHLIPAR